MNHVPAQSPAGSLMDPRDCPYVGLDPFDASHAEYFFGRGQDSKILADHVRARPITVLYGPSGIGKSSILNVGLPAALAAGRGWIIALLRNWQNPDPLERLAVEAVLRALPAGPRHQMDHIRLVPLIARVTRSTRQPLLLILDQFEEYFLYRDRDHMRQLETAMADLITRASLPVHLLIALREDALYRLDELRLFAPNLLDTTIRLGHLSDAAVEEAIRGPIERYNSDYRAGNNRILVEHGLVLTLIRQLKEAEIGLGKGDTAAVEQRPIEPSYLQLALTKLWFAEGGTAATALHEATLTDESKLGGVRRIVRDHVNGVMNRLTDDEKRLCARIFDRLVTGIGSKIAILQRRSPRQRWPVTMSARTRSEQCCKS
jgi:hypothetical protein